MSLIKGLFSKLFSSSSSQSHSSNVVPTEGESKSGDLDLIKSAAQSAVMSAFDEKKPVNSPKRNLDLQNESMSLKSKENVNFDNARVMEILNDYNEKFFGAFKVSQNDYSLKPDKQNMIVIVNNQDFESSLSQSNKLSLSYEHIFLRLVQKEFRYFNHRLSLQSGNSVNHHQQNIKSLAHKMAVKVKKTGQKVSLPARTSYERSLIHQVVAKFPGLASKSVGPHFQRRLIIYSLASNPKQAIKPNHNTKTHDRQ